MKLANDGLHEEYPEVANYIVLSFMYFLEETVIIPLLTISGMITRIITHPYIK